MSLPVPSKRRFPSILTSVYIFPTGAPIARPRRSLSCAARAALLLSLCLSIGWQGVSSAATADTIQPAGLVTQPSIQQSKQLSSSTTRQILIEKILQAYGGLEKMKELDALAFRSVGKLLQLSTISGAGNSYDTEILSKGEKVRAEVKLMGQPLITGYDGKRSWLQQGNQVFPADPTTNQRIEEEVKHGLVLLLKMTEQDRKVELGPPRDANGESCLTLLVYADDGKPTTFYANENGVIVRSEFLGTDLEQGLSALKAYDYSDNRPVMGSLMPFKIVEFSGDKKTSETLLSKIEQADLSDSIFEMPTETKIARLQQGPVKLPFDYVSNEIVVKASINGRHDLRFIVDTGATQSVIDVESARQVGEYKVSDHKMTTGSGAVNMNYMTFEEFKLGDVCVHDVPFAVTEIGTFKHMAGVRPDGLIGANVLKRFLLTIDYEKKELILQDPSKVAVVSGAHIIKTKPALGMGGLAVDGKIDGTLPVTFLIDTGAAFNNVPLDVVKTILTSPLLPVTEVLGLDGRKIPTGSVRFKSLAMDGLMVSDPIFSVAPKSEKIPAGMFSGTPLGILGNPFWRRFRMTVDYRNERLILERTPGLVAYEKLMDQLEEVRLRYIRKKNADGAIQEYSKIAASAEKQHLPAAAALAHSCVGQAIEQKMRAAENPALLREAENQFARAQSFAQQARERDIEAKVLSRWARMYLNNAHGANEVKAARALLARAEKMSQDSEVSAVGGMLFVLMRNYWFAEQYFNQALGCDPANWEALWGKYALSKMRGKSQESQLVASQLKQYYPFAPEVLAIGDGASEKAQTEKGAAQAGAKTSKVTGSTVSPPNGSAKTSSKESTAKSDAEPGGPRAESGQD